MTPIQGDKSVAGHAATPYYSQASLVRYEIILKQFSQFFRHYFTIFILKSPFLYINGASQLTQLFVSKTHPLIGLTTKKRWDVKKI
tara:strand:- start:66 stop:323 length:258 start_codon:yes stop_codon:yes gene_type:complete